MRKGDKADGQRAKVMGSFTTEGEGEERMLQTLMQLVVTSVTITACVGLEFSSFLRVSSVRLCYFSVSTYLLSTYRN